MKEQGAATKLWVSLTLVVVLGAAALSVWQGAPEPIRRVMPTGTVAPPASAVASAAAKGPFIKPLWSELSAAQRQALAPLESEWNEMGSVRKRKWLEVATRFAKMKPEEQQRAHERMRELNTLTPEQRRAVRANLAKTTKTAPANKAELWEQYQQLSDEEKKKLAEKAQAKKLVANIAPPSEAKVPTVAPLKTAPAADPNKAAQPAPAATGTPVSTPPAATPAPVAPPAPTPASDPGTAAPAASGTSSSTPPPQINAK